jgi:cobyrinic acid a,c-diamide synthase
MSILLDVPVILVIDTQGITRGIAPLLQGYVNFEKKCNIKGIILNKVSTERHESKLINSVENYTDLKILGSVRKNKDLVISERHLGLIPANEKKVVEKKINAISNIISESISKKEFSALGINFKKKKIDKKIVQNITTKKVITKIKIGVFYDSSFGFYYADDIENLKKYGAEIVYINAVKNKKIPNVDAIFIGGGFPEINAEKLSKNKILMLNLKNFIEEEKPCYAECGGLMYLSESIKYNSKKYKMVGIIPGCVNMSEKPIGRGYVKLEVKKNHLWNSAPTGIINAHEFHHANLILNKGVKSNFSYNVKRGYGINGKSDGYMYKKLLANFTHLRNTEQYPWVKYFINFIKESKND